ncbi:hypothetical protein [Polyangium sp. y55x31]|uniref:SecDF P1 head subdomain-containing protein n=1 Tax=Polyangium sp. y55x31 TaxID=3042688 RepID=UPI002482B3E7|nr:hypothetical protein [Polyangium sp. y55x31]MDI1477328.1 hypothetical protein [Polyangium sp. y55x31]
MDAARASMTLLAALALSPFGYAKNVEAADDSGLQPMTMEIVLVDDRFDAFAKPVGPLPEGVSLRVELVPTGPGAHATNHYAVLLKKPGETDTQAKERFSPWLSAQPLPAGRRFVLGDVIQENEAGETQSIGLRTYVLTGEPIVTEANVVDASVGMEGAPIRQGVVTVTLDAAGGERFHAATREHVDERIAIVVDGKAFSVPVVKAPIPGGQFWISTHEYGVQAVAEAERLAARLRGKAK